ncbi:MAG: cysteine hydrolase [Acidobacteria bacterium]|nr:cysteine hydrolase [Acidobacteriota bacterium]
MPENYVKWEFERDRSVLMVIDMQNDFVLDGAVMQVKEAKNHLPKIKKLIGRCRELGVPVIYTIQETDPVFCPLEVSAFPHLRDAGMRKGTKGMQIVDCLAPEPDDIVIRKRRFSAFYQTDLEIILRNIRGNVDPVDAIIICGTVTNICCESTARDAFFRDYKVVFGTDICSANTPESHNATLANMEIFGRNMDCETIIKSLETGRG